MPLVPLVLIASMLLSSCLKDDILDVDATGSPVVNIFIPESEVVAVRGATSDAEKKIYFGYFFVFNSSGGYILHERFDESNRLAGTNISTLQLSISAAAKIPLGGKVIIIANVDPMTNLESPGGTKPTFDNAYTYFPLNAGGSLIDVATPGLGDFKMPMYGEVNSWSAANPTIVLKRAMAKITVRVSNTLANVGQPGYSNFSNIGNVKYKIYNYARKGAVEPGRNYTSGQSGWTTSIASGNEINNSVSLSNSPTASSTGISFVYAYPYSNYRTSSTAAIGTKVLHTERFAVIVKAGSRYYRLDLCDLGGNYFNIDADKHYKFTINKVTGNGHDTPTNALQAPPSNIDYHFEVNAGEEITLANELLSMSITPRHHSYVQSTHTSNGSTSGDVFHIYFEVRLETAKLPDGTRVPVPGGMVFSAYGDVNHVGNSVTWVHGDVTNNSTIGNRSIGTKHTIQWRTDFVSGYPTSGWQGTMNFRFTFGSGAYKLEKIIPIRVSLIGTKWTEDIMTMDYNVALNNPYGGAYQSTQWVGSSGVETFTAAYGHKVDNHGIKFEANIYNTNGNIGYGTTPTFKEWRRIVGKHITQTANGRSRTWIDVNHRSGIYLGRRGDQISPTNFAPKFGENSGHRGMKHALTTRRNHRVVSPHGTSRGSSFANRSASQTIHAYNSHWAGQASYVCLELAPTNRQWYKPTTTSISSLAKLNGSMWQAKGSWNTSSCNPANEWVWLVCNVNSAWNVDSEGYSSRYYTAMVACIRPLGGEKNIADWRQP